MTDQEGGVHYVNAIHVFFYILGMFLLKIFSRNLLLVWRFYLKIMEVPYKLLESIECICEIQLKVHNIKWSS